MESVASDYRARRQRLFNPPNGRVSSELEIATEPALRRKRPDTLAEGVRQAKQARIAAQVARLEALKVAYATALARRGSGPGEPLPALRPSCAEAILIQNLPIIEPLPPRAPFIQQIIAEVCRRYNVTQVDVRSQRRTAHIVLPRQIIIYIARTMTLLSYPQIGRHMGGRDHTTCLHASNKIAGLVDNSPHLSAEINDIMATIAARQLERG
jgi:hypothetical protein